MSYRCLVTDHDDTSVASTPTIHYPAYLRMMRELRPSVPPLTLEGFFWVNFHPGYFEHMRRELGMNDEEVAREVEIWREYVSMRIPGFFPGFLDVLKEHRRRGGAVAVISHSEKDIILRDYRAAGDAAFVPDIVYGWDDEEQRRKPNPYPLRRILDDCGVAADDVLVVDDLLPGITMARSVGAHAAAAGWGHRIARIRRAFEGQGVPYLERVQDLARYLTASE